MKKINKNCVLLPSKLITHNKSLEALIEEATKILINDFSKGQAVFRGKKISAQYPYTNKKSYLHILKLDDDSATIPQKIERAIHSPQFSKLIELSKLKNCCDEFKCWREFDIKKSRWCTKLLCPINKLFIILGEKRDKYILVTAYHLLGNGVVKQIEKYNNSKNKL